MSNLAIIKDGKILYFIKDCVREKNGFFGSNMKIAGVNLTGLTLKWTDDDALPIKGKDGDISGYAKVPGELTETQEGARINPPSHADYAAAIKLRSVISNLTYSEIDGMVDAIFPALTAAQKNFLKNHAKATLAIARIMDRRI